MVMAVEDQVVRAAPMFTSTCQLHLAQCEREHMRVCRREVGSPPPPRPGGGGGGADPTPGD
jgi:hypothetical protein